MMISTENIFVIFLLNFHDMRMLSRIPVPYVIHVRLMADKGILQTYFTVKDKYIIIAIRGCTNIQCYLKDKISKDFAK